MKDFSKTQLFCLLQEYLEKGDEMNLKSIFQFLDKFLEELQEYIHSKRDFETLSRSLNLASIAFDSLKDYYCTNAQSSIGICIRSIQLCLKKEIELMNEKVLHPEWFIVNSQNYSSNLQFIPKSPDFGIVFLAEIVIALSKAQIIKTPDYKSVPLIQLAKSFELMFNCQFGNIYDLQDQIYRRKPFNRTKGLDHLSKVLVQDEKQWICNPLILK